MMNSRQNEAIGNWPSYRLEDVSEIVSGITLGRSVGETITRSVPYLRVANVKDGRLDLADVKTVEATEAEIAKLTLRRGDLLLTEGGDPDKLGRGTFWEEQLPLCIHQNHIFRVRFPADQFWPEFASFLFASPYGKAYFLAHAKQTTGIASINKTVLGGFPMLLPPLPEQRRLAGRLREQLAAVADARTALQAQLAAAAALPAACLHDVFSSAETHQWARRDLGQCVSMLPAASISSSGEVKVQVITSACLSETGFSVTGIKTAAMKRHDADRAMVAPGEVLIARSNTPELVGRVAAVPDDIGRVAASDLTIRLLPGPQLEAHFLARFLACLQLEGFWKEKAGGASGTMKKITRGQLDTLQLPLPPLARQRFLSTRLEATFAEIATLRTALEARLAAVERLPAALLREVFGG